MTATTILSITCVLALAFLAVTLMTLGHAKSLLRGEQKWLNDARTGKALAEKNVKELEDEVTELKIKLSHRTELQKALETRHDTVLSKPDGVRFYFDVTRPEIEIGVLKSAIETLDQAVGYDDVTMVFPGNGYSLGAQGAIAREFCMRAEREFCKRGVSSIIALAKADLEQCVERIAEAASQ